MMQLELETFHGVVVQAAEEYLRSQDDLTKIATTAPGAKAVAPLAAEAWRRHRRLLTQDLWRRGLVRPQIDALLHAWREAILIQSGAELTGLARPIWRPSSPELATVAPPELPVLRNRVLHAVGDDIYAVYRDWCLERVRDGRATILATAPTDAPLAASCPGPHGVLAVASTGAMYGSTANGWTELDTECDVVSKIMPRSVCWDIARRRLVLVGHRRDKSGEAIEVTALWSAQASWRVLDSGDLYLEPADAGPQHDCHMVYDWRRQCVLFAGHRQVAELRNERWHQHSNARVLTGPSKAASGLWLHDPAKRETALYDLNEGVFYAYDGTAMVAVDAAEDAPSALDSLPTGDARARRAAVVFMPARRCLRLFGPRDDWREYWELSTSALFESALQHNERARESKMSAMGLHRRVLDLVRAAFT